MKLEVQNLNGVLGMLKRLPVAATKELEAGLVREAGRVMDEAQRRVPVVTGQLRSSAFVHNDRRKGGSLSIGYDAPHAIYVHEIPFSGKTTKGLPGAVRNGQGYKWLEKSVRQALTGAKERLVRAIRAAMAKR